MLLTLNVANMHLVKKHCQCQVVRHSCFTKRLPSALHNWGIWRKLKYNHCDDDSIAMPNAVRAT